MLRVRCLREHDADDAHIVSLVRAVDGGGLASVLLGPFADFLMVGNDVGHDDLLRSLSRLTIESQWRS
jgi:hypothetical protein